MKENTRERSETFYMIPGRAEKLVDLFYQNLNLV